jgi:hypothetical protein
MSIEELTDRQLHLKAQLLTLDNKLRRSHKSRKLPKKEQLIKINSAADLRKHRSIILRNTKTTPAALFLIDPVRALEEMGFRFSTKMRKSLLQESGIRLPKDRTLYDAVKNGSRKIPAVKRIRISAK